MSDRYDPRERWRWEEEREREDQGLESEGRFARHGGDLRWGTGGLGVDRHVIPPGARLRIPVPDLRGPFVGVGPRGYRRTDEHILEDVCRRMTDEGELDASGIEVSVTGGEVMLAGVVPTRAQKRLAEDIADAVTGVTEVHNRLRAHREGVEPSRPAPASGPAGTPTGAGGRGLNEGSSAGR